MPPRRRLPSPHQVMARRLRALLGPDLTAAGQSLGALLAALTGATIAGLTLGSVTESLEALPGLLVLVPGAIALRGATFGALGARLGTAVHTGTFVLGWRRETIVGQNVIAAAVVTLVGSTLLGVLAKGVAVAFGLVPTISLADLVTISVVAGVLASSLLAVFTLGVASLAARLGWDMDNVTAPLVTAVSDMVTLPLLVLATVAADLPVLTPLVATAAAVGATVALVAAVRSHYDELRRIVSESVPVVTVASIVSLTAGVVIEKRLESLSELPALLVLFPPYLALGGALGGILSSRLTSKLHLGVIEATTLPSREARADISLVYVLATPMFALAAIVVAVVASASGLARPALSSLVPATMLAAAGAVTFAVMIAYWSAVAAVRLGLDPDNYGIPLVTSSMDLVGAFSLIVAVVTFGIV